MAGRIIAIGDIHGCRDKLIRLLELVAPGRTDTLVFVGDYIDRGPDSRGVVETILSLKEEIPRVICLRGNHEEMFLALYKEGKGGLSFLYNGGGATLSSYGLTMASALEGRGLPEEHLLFFSSLPLYYETGDYLFVHAGLRPGLTLAEQSPEDLLWIREEFMYSDWDFGRIVVFGHTPCREPFLKGGRFGIDTGAVYGGFLTGLELPSCRIYQA